MSKDSEGSSTLIANYPQEIIINKTKSKGGGFGHKGLDGSETCDTLLLRFPEFLLPVKFIGTKFVEYILTVVLQVTTKSTN
jgi:hypothetical protein